MGSSCFIKMKKIFILFITCLVLSGCATSRFHPQETKTNSQVSVERANDGWRLFVNGEPFFIKGIVYVADKIGESAHRQTLRDWAIVDDDNDGRIDVAYQSWVDANRNNEKDAGEDEVGDFQLLLVQRLHDQMYLL